MRWDEDGIGVSPKTARLTVSRDEIGWVSHVRGGTARMAYG